MVLNYQKYNESKKKTFEIGDRVIAYIGGSHQKGTIISKGYDVYGVEFDENLGLLFQSNHKDFLLQKQHSGKLGHCYYISEDCLKKINTTIENIKEEDIEWF
jgi:hypothetical protein